MKWMKWNEMKLWKCIFFMKFHWISMDKKGSPNEIQALYYPLEGLRYRKDFLFGEWTILFSISSPLFSFYLLEGAGALTGSSPPVWPQSHVFVGLNKRVHWSHFPLLSARVWLKKMKRHNSRTPSLELIITHFTPNEMNEMNNIVSNFKWNEMKWNVNHFSVYVKWNSWKCIFFMKFHWISMDKKGSPNEIQVLFYPLEGLRYRKDFLFSDWTILFSISSSLFTLCLLCSCRMLSYVDAYYQVADVND